MISFGLDRDIDRPLKAGARFQLTDEGARVLRPRGVTTGRLIRDDGDEWKIVYDGTATVRSLHKSFIQAEAER